MDPEAEARVLRTDDKEKTYVSAMTEVKSDTEGHRLNR